MDFDIVCKTITGTYHRTLHAKNQDAYCSMQDDGFCCLCIADGAGSKAHSELGARWLVKDICHLLLGQAENFFSMSYDSIRNAVVLQLQKSLRKTALQQNVLLGELSSTLMFALTDGKQFLLGHLGDGAIIGEHGGRWNVLSFPQNGEYANITYLSTMPAVERHLRLHRSQCAGIHRIWLLTDGAMYAAFQPGFSIAKDTTLEKAIHSVDTKEINDDATYGYISWKEETNYESCQ